MTLRKENDMKAKLSKLSKTFIIVGCILACLFVAVMIYYLGASYPSFEKISAQAFEIPGLETKFVPQGLAHEQNGNNFLVCGYMGDGSASRIYVVNGETGKAEKYVTLTNEDSTDYVGHAGGITVDYPNAYICGDGFVYRFDYADLESAENGGKSQIRSSYKTGNGADFLSIIDGKLVVGEFYRQQNYPTPESHHITLGEQTNRALSFVYDLDQTKAEGFNTEMLYAISMPDLVQGMCLTKDGNIVLSTSYGLSNSALYIYKNYLTDPTTTQTQIDGRDVPVYFLGQDNLIETYNEVPCMSEEIVLVDGRVHVLFESMCHKYKLVTRTRMSHVWSLDI